MINCVRCARLFCYIVLPIFLSNCASTVEPEQYLYQEKLVPDQYAMEKYFDLKTPSEEGLLEWWKSLNDPLLDKYIKILLTDNISLKQAVERIQQAEARRSSALASWWPSISVNQNASRSLRGGSDLPNSYQTSHASQLSLSWTADIFGRIRNSVKLSDTNLLMSKYDHQALQNLYIARLIELRVAIASLLKIESLAKVALEHRRLLENASSLGYKKGVANISLERVVDARAKSLQMKTDLERLGHMKLELMYQFDVLLGRKPGTTDFREEGFDHIPQLPSVVVGVPAAILDQRPDINAARLNVEAANAQAKIAVADLYPNFTIGLNSQITSDNLSTLLSSHQLVSTLLGNISLRVFQGGAINANIAIRESQVREAASAYASSILNALKEVEVALSKEKYMAQELEDRKQILNAHRIVVNTASMRYEHGTGTLSSLLALKHQLYNYERQVLEKYRDVWNNRLSLNLALGGYWSSESLLMANVKDL